ncbi:MAG: RNA polymerase sigma factor [Candidatus Ventricola sp.]
MSKICTHFDLYFGKWSAPVGALCTLLIQNRADAQDVAFQTFLRLGGAKDHEIGEEAARILLFGSAVRLCDDYYLKKMHRRPSRKKLEQMALPFPVTDALVSLLRLPFRRQAALALTQFGFSQSEVAELLGVRPQKAARLCADPGIPGWQDALSSMEMTEDEALALSDRIYERFAVRSVDVENAIHDARNAFDRAAPILALLVLALFSLAIWYVKR